MLDGINNRDYENLKRCILIIAGKLDIEFWQCGCCNKVFSGDSYGTITEGHGWPEPICERCFQRKEEEFPVLERHESQGS